VGGGDTSMLDELSLEKLPLSVSLLEPSTLPASAQALCWVV
jgi:hypothetical protein